MKEERFKLTRIRGAGDPILDDEIITDLKRVAESEGTTTLTQRLYTESGKFNCSTVSRRFGSWAQAVAKAGLTPGDNRRPLRVSDKQLLEDMRRVAQDLGKDTVGMKEYGERGRYAYNTVNRRFGSWNKALRSAGLAISNRVNIADDELFENILDLWQHYGRQPRRRELASRPSKFSTGPYTRRFGSWKKALEAFVENANESGHEPPPVGEFVHSESIDSSAKVDRVPSASLASQPMASKRPSTPRDPNYRLRYRVLQVDKFSCRACGASPAKDPGVELHVDHIVPWSRGGETRLENLQTLCSRCNLGKSNVL